MCLVAAEHLPPKVKDVTDDFPRLRKHSATAPVFDSRVAAISPRTGFAKTFDYVESLVLFVMFVDSVLALDYNGLSGILMFNLGFEKLYVVNNATKGIPVDRRSLITSIGNFLIRNVDTDNSF